MTDEQEGADPVGGNVEILVSLAEIRGQLTTFINMVGRLDDRQAKLEDRQVKQETRQNEADNRLTAIESSQAATRNATPPWWTWLPAVCAVIAIAFAVVDRL